MTSLMIERASSLRSWYSDRLRTIRPEELAAYLVAALSQFNPIERSNSSIVLHAAEVFCSARTDEIISLGDRALWTSSVLLTPESRDWDVHVELGRIAFDRSYRLTGRSWKIFERLADDLPKIAISVKDCITS